MGLAYAVFVVALLLEPTIRRRPAATWISERSYSVYLLHLYTGTLVLDALAGHVTFTIALVLAVLTTMLACELTYRLVERPARRFARGLSARWVRRTVPARTARARFRSSSYTLNERT
jgi:peptidoglycan/LPS O-acetylase OafA/YrhL